MSYLDHFDFHERAAIPVWIQYVLREADEERVEELDIAMKVINDLERKVALLEAECRQLQQKLLEQ